MIEFTPTFTPINLLGWIFLVILAIRYIIQLRISQKQDHSQKGEGSLHPIFITIFYVLILIGSAYALLFELEQLNPYILGLGFLVYVMGAIVRSWSLISLGQFYSENIIIRKGHQLVTSGIYSICRHPLHTGFLLELAGMTIFSQFVPLNIPWLLLPYLGFVVIIYIRTSKEERILNDQFGESYKAYMKQVPGINIFWGILKKSLQIKG